MTERTYYAILNEREFVYEDTVDKFCCNALTDFWITDLDWERGREVLKEHGTIARYRQGCRCDECRHINTYRQRATKARNAMPSEYAKHGEYARALAGCRCERCKERLGVLEAVGRLK